MFQRLKNTALFSDNWNVAFRKSSAGMIMEDRESPFTIIGNPVWGWAADPFPVEHEGQTYIFAELFNYVQHRGWLGYCKVTGNKVGKWKVIIKEPYHLSYPCIFKKDGRIYMMPESGEGKELAIYEAVQFPDRWEKRRVLRSDVELADTTPLGVGKLALSHYVKDAYHPQLLLIDLAGEKPDRTVDREPFRSRPGGYPFVHQGQNIRPAQLSDDCGLGYGKGLIFCRWQVDENLDYQEQEFCTLCPNDLRYNRKMDLIGLHTYNAGAGYEVVDVKTRRMNPIDRFMGLLSRMK